MADPGQAPAGLPAAAPGAPAPDALPPGAPPPPDAQPPGEAPASGGLPGFMAPPGGGAGDRGNVVQAALTQVGTPYSWGGAGPGGSTAPDW